MNLPDREGIWWYEHADYPMIVNRINGELCAYHVDDCWHLVTEMVPGWWKGPLVKPDGPFEPWTLSCGCSADANDNRTWCPVHARGD